MNLTPNTKNINNLNKNSTIKIKVHAYHTENSTFNKQVKDTNSNHKYGTLTVIANKLNPI